MTPQASGSSTTYQCIPKNECVSIDWDIGLGDLNLADLTTATITELEVRAGKMWGTFDSLTMIISYTKTTDPVPNNS